MEERIRNLRKLVGLSLIVSSVSASSISCANMNNRQKGAIIGGLGGALAGAVVGHQSGHDAGGAIIGGVTGAAAGYAIGNEKDKELFCIECGRDYKPGSSFCKVDGTQLRYKQY
jgi:uncharacterized protein YcfJ